MNKNLAQIGRQLAASGNNSASTSRISVVMATFVVVIGLVALSLYSSRVDYSLLYGKLDEAEASKVIAALDEAKVPYKVSRAGGAIFRSLGQGLSTPHANGRQRHPQREGVGFEILTSLTSASPISSSAPTNTRAVQGELAAHHQPA